MARQHLLTPEQHMLKNEYREVNRLAWALRKLTGEALEIGIKLRVPPELREEVRKRLEFIKQKHAKK